jgi:TonB family protein
MKKTQFFHSYVAICFVLILLFAVSCDTEMSNEEILDSDLETISFNTLLADSAKAGTISFLKIYSFIDKKGDVSLLNSRILQSDGDRKAEEFALKIMGDQNFLTAVKQSKNGKEVIFDFSISYYKPNSKVEFIPYDKAPQPVGGLAAIQRNIIYPKIAQLNKIEGTVVIQGFLNKNGNMEQFHILKGIENSGLNEAAVSALKKTKFTPAEQKGQKVGVWITIPIVFKL